MARTSCSDALANTSMYDLVLLYTLLVDHPRNTGQGCQLLLIQRETYGES